MKKAGFQSFLVLVLIIAIIGGAIILANKATNTEVIKDLENSSTLTQQQKSSFLKNMLSFFFENKDENIEKRTVGDEEYNKSITQEKDPNDQETIITDIYNPGCWYVVTIDENGTEKNRVKECLET